MTNLDFLIDKVPWILRSENNLKLLKVLSDPFDKIEEDLNNVEGMWLASEAIGPWLDLYGQNLNIYREGDSDAVYRQRIQIVIFNLYFVPILNNFEELLIKVLGYDIEDITEGWRLPTPESGVLKVTTIIPSEKTDVILTDLDAVYSAGCRIDWESFQEAFAIYEKSGNKKSGLRRITRDYVRTLIPQ